MRSPTPGIYDAIAITVEGFEKLSYDGIRISFVCIIAVTALKFDNSVKALNEFFSSRLPDGDISLKISYTSFAS